MITNQFFMLRRLLGVTFALGMTLALVGCTTQKASTTTTRAPVEDRGTAATASRTGVGVATTSNPATSGAATAALPPGSENAGKPGYYTVKPGDTLIRVGLENGQNWRDLVRWNQLESPNRIEVGQVIRVIPPVAVATPVPSPGSNPTLPVVVPPVVASAPSAAAGRSGAEEVNWIWPTASTTLIAGFDEVKNKGLDIGGKLGDAVVAAGDGRVVYAGAGLRGYGNLVIIKHNDVFLSAYAHNQTLLVKEDQSVTKGQKIAEMGQSDADRVKLHFEIRRQGKPVDPAQYLPKR